MKFTIGACGLRLEIHGIQGIVTLLALVTTGLAVEEQLRRPPAERTWHGHLWDFIPYDFRVPSLDQALRSFWDPESSQILKDKTFGVGWDLNFAAVARELSAHT